MIKAGVIGATGYTGVELLRLLAPRPDVELCVVTSRELQGKAVASHFPNLRGHLDLRFAAADSAELKQCDVVFFATPHAVAMYAVRELLEAGVRVIDLSADFRLQDLALWQRWYGVEHACPELVPEAVYGLPEVNREQIRGARLLAVPGCYPTAVQLGFLPLVELGLVATQQLIADAKSGVSGAGRKAQEDLLLCEASESIKAYAVGGHRHHPEICQGLARATSEPIGFTFIPHLTPMIRGILATLYAPLKSAADMTPERLQRIFEDRYASEPFVRVLPAGELPATRAVRGSNKCDISATYLEEARMIVVLSAEDNLVKGASGQAIQNMNLMFGCDETAGLDAIALLP